MFQKRQGEQVIMVTTIQTTKVYVEVDAENKTLRQFIVNLAKKHGKEGSSFNLQDRHVLLHLDEGGLHGAGESVSYIKEENTKVSIEEFVKAIEAPIEPTVRLGGYEVTFDETTFTFAGLTFTYREFDDFLKDYDRYREDVPF